MNKVNKLDRAELFRDRLSEALRQRGMSRSALARGIGVDRSTISQILSDDGARMPGGALVAACAATLGVTADWLLGLSDRPERMEDMLANTLRMSAAERALVDEQIFAWHREAAGRKIRSVPATLPDFLKTPEVLRWEYGGYPEHRTDMAIQTARELRDWVAEAESDYEIALPLFTVDSLAMGEGYWKGLPREASADQLSAMAETLDQFYPRVRLYLFDARRTWSSPLTVYGPGHGVIYLGRSFIAIRDRERVRGMTKHFDALVRQASVPAREAWDNLSRLAAVTDGA